MAPFRGPVGRYGESDDDDVQPVVNSNNSSRSRTLKPQSSSSSKQFSYPQAIAARAVESKRDSSHHRRSSIDHNCGSTASDQFSCPKPPKRIDSFEMKKKQYDDDRNNLHRIDYPEDYKDDLGYDENNNFPVMQEHKSLDFLLAEEMSRMHIADQKQRTQYGHYGYSENPEFIDYKLQEMDIAIDRIPQKESYELAECISSQYLDDPSFRLMFLRAENFNPDLAAVRLVRCVEDKLMESTKTAAQVQQVNLERVPSLARATSYLSCAYSIHQFPNSSDDMSSLGGFSSIAGFNSVGGDTVDKLVNVSDWEGVLLASTNRAPSAAGTLPSVLDMNGNKSVAESSLGTTSLNFDDLQKFSEAMKSVKSKSVTRKTKSKKSTVEKRKKKKGTKTKRKKVSDLTGDEAPKSGDPVKRKKKTKKKKQVAVAKRKKSAGRPSGSDERKTRRQEPQEVKNGVFSEEDLVVAKKPAREAKVSASKEKVKQSSRKEEITQSELSNSDSKVGKLKKKKVDASPTVRRKKPSSDPGKKIGDSTLNTESKQATTSKTGTKAITKQAVDVVEDRSTPPTQSFLYGRKLSKEPISAKILRKVRMYGSRGRTNRERASL